MSSVAQSYRDVFVTNNGSLLKNGFTDQLAVGQLGIFLYDPKKDQVAVSAPNFQTTKAIQVVQGTPNTPTNLLAATASQSDKSKPIKGKKILSWSGAKASRGANQITAIGFDGVDVTKTLTAKCEQSKTVFVKLSGGPIDQAFHAEGKGIVREYAIFSGCCDDCGDDCANVSADTMADALIDQFNNDPIFSLGGQNSASTFNIDYGNRFARARKLVPVANLPTPDSNCTEFLLSICDNGDDTSLGVVQSNVSPNFSGTPNPPSAIRKSREGSISTYSIIVPEDLPNPVPFSNAGLSVISDCPVCPAGYNLLNAGFITLVSRQDAGDAGALTAVKSAYSITGSETGVRVSYSFGQSDYVLVSTAAINAAIGTDVISSLGQSRNSCVLATPTSIAWVAGDTYDRYDKDFTITLKDNVCGTSRLTELQAAYPDLVISETTVGECTRLYTATVTSNCVPPGCPADAPQWITPQAFYGTKWATVVASPTTNPVGVVIESSYVDRITGECAYDYWSYDAEPVFIEISQHSQDYNDKPTICANEWPVTEIQGVQLPTGVGSKVRELEAFFKGYRGEYRDLNPIVRELQNSILQTDPNKFYDSYILEFEFEFHQSWFSEKLTDTYRLEVYFPEGTGKEFETAINGYVTSVPLNIDPVVL